MFDLIAGVLAWLYEITKSYGLAIVGLTILVNVVTTPFTLKSTKSMLEMQRLQPELKRIQTEFKQDRPRMNEEMMAFYKEHQINPLGGCVPMLIQLPVFMVLYRVLSGLTTRFTSVGLAAGQLTAQASTGAAFAAVEIERRKFNPQYVDHGDTIFQDLQLTNEMNSFGIDLSRSLSQMLQEGFVKALPYLALDHVGVRHLARPAAADPGSEQQRSDEPSATGDHEDHPLHDPDHLVRPARGHGGVLPHREPVPDRPAGLHHAEVLPRSAGSDRGVTDGHGARGWAGQHRGEVGASLFGGQPPYRRASHTIVETLDPHGGQRLVDPGFGKFEHGQEPSYDRRSDAPFGANRQSHIAVNEEQEEEDLTWIGCK